MSKVKPGLTVDEAAEFLELKASYLSQLRHYNKGPGYAKIGNRIYYAKEDLKAWLADRKAAKAVKATEKAAKSPAKPKAPKASKAPKVATPKAPKAAKSPAKPKAPKVPKAAKAPTPEPVATEVVATESAPVAA